MRRPPHRRVDTRKVRFRPLLEVAEARILLSITSRGPAAIVNSSTAGDQNSPAVAMDANGDSIVVWKDAYKENPAGQYESDIRAQRYSPTGAKVHQDGTTPGAQEFIVQQETDAPFIERDNPAVAMDPAGDFVVAWVRNDTTVTGKYLYEIQARVFNAAGMALTSDINITANTTTDRNTPAVAMDGSGNWVITWTEEPVVNNAVNDDVFAKKFSLNGTQQNLNNSSSALLVNSGATAGNQFSSSVGSDASGNFDVTWTSLAAGSGLDTEVFARQFNSNATVQGSLIHVNVTTTNGQGSSKIAVTSAGDFIVVWVNDLDDGSPNRGDIFARRFNSDGSARTGEFQVNSNSLGFQNNPDVALDANGNATVVWGNISNSNGSNPGVFARRVNAQGVPIEASDFRVATLTGTDQDSPAVAVDNQGDAAFAYRQINGTGPSTDTDIFTHFYKYVNDAPTIDTPSNLTINQGAGAQTVNLSGIAAGGGESQTLVVSASSNNTGLIPNPVVTYTSPNATGSIAFTPVAGVFGAATITLTVTDNGGTANGGVNSASRQFTVTVVGKPTANNQSVSTNQNTAVAVTLTGSDPNSPPKSLTYTVTANPSHGSLSGTAPNLTYTPNTGYTGPDSFQFKDNNGALDSAIATVSITVNGTNHAPTANPQTVTVAQDTAKSVTLTGSDPDAGDTLTYTVTANPSHGSLSGTAPNLTYTPTTGYFGADSFQFKVTDNHGAASTPATVSLTVVGKPTANNQSVSTNQNTAVAVTLTGSDPNSPPKSLTYTVASQPTHGSLTGTAPNLTYTPTAGYQGSDSFTFTDSNGINSSSPATVSIHVAAGVPTANPQTVGVAFNTATAVTLTGSDPDSPPLALTYTVATSPSHGSLSGTAPNLTYTPNAGYHGPDSFTFTVNNGTNTSPPATVSLNVATGVPTANPQTVNVNENGSVGVSLTGSDPDVPALPLTFALVGGTTTTHGTISGFNASTGALTYTPNAGYSGGDSFQFTVSNGTNTGSPATVTLSVSHLSATISGNVGIAWGTSGTTTLQTNGDGLRLLPAGRKTDLPWLGINKLNITLDRAATLNASDVSVTGIAIANYGPVTVSGSGTSYTITLAQPINAADRVTVTIGNADVNTFTRRLDVLPGDFNDDSASSSPAPTSWASAWRAPRPTTSSPISMATASSTSTIPRPFANGSEPSCPRSPSQKPEWTGRRGLK